MRRPPIHAYPFLPIDNVPQRVAGVGTVAFTLVPTADGGVTTGQMINVPPPIRVPGGAAPTPAPPAHSLAKLLPGMSPILPVTKLSVVPGSGGGGAPASAPLVYASQGGTASPSSNRTALMVGVLVLVLGAGAYVATRKKG